MTSIPRMTGTSSSNKTEYMIASILLLGQTVFPWQLDARLFYRNQILLTCFLITFGVLRISRATKPMPVFFSHVGIAMLLALLGSFFYFIGDSRMGLHLYHIGTVLVLVLGLGTRFFSFLSGLPSIFEDTKSTKMRLLFHGSGLLVGVLLFFAGLGHFQAYLALGLVSLVYLLFFWKVQRPSNRPSALKYGVRIVATMIPVSFFCTWLQPTMAITWLHLLFIGCFSLITFSVATRVTLAHGSYPIKIEMNSPSLWVFLVSLSLAIIFRLIYGFSGILWKSTYLHAAVTFWLCAVFSWSWAFLPRITKSGSQPKAAR